MKLRDFIFWGLFIVVVGTAVVSYATTIWTNLHPQPVESKTIVVPVKVIELCAGQPV